MTQSERSYIGANRSLVFESLLNHWEYATQALIDHGVSGLTQEQLRERVEGWKRAWAEALP